MKSQYEVGCRYFTQPSIRFPAQCGGNKLYSFVALPDLNAQAAGCVLCAVRPRLANNNPDGSSALRLETLIAKARHLGRGRATENMTGPTGGCRTAVQPQHAHGRTGALVRAVLAEDRPGEALSRRAADAGAGATPALVQPVGHARPAVVRRVTGHCREVCAATAAAEPRAASVFGTRVASLWGEAHH